MGGGMVGIKVRSKNTESV